LAFAAWINDAGISLQIGDLYLSKYQQHSQPTGSTRILVYLNSMTPH